MGWAWVEKRTHALRQVKKGSKGELQGGGGVVERGLAALDEVIGWPGKGILCPEYGSKGSWS